jgi:hypothetical protein
VTRFQIENKEKTINVIGGVIKKDDAKAVFDNVEKFVAALKFENAKATEGPKKEEVNGLEQKWYAGKATIKDDAGKEVKIEWDLTVVSGGKANLFLIGFGQLDKNEKVYEKFFESIKKADDKDD